MTDRIYSAENAKTEVLWLKEITLRRDSSWPISFLYIFDKNMAENIAGTATNKPLIAKSGRFIK
ncbi:hypothetical protein [uncultured Methanomethylovorans sp.]|uniref:hypothetical protein n=1 Tax=uncultured Methanomethylovorans sp. TaxID=183759 RepID=UPI002AA8D674|nr:hypothetical protein [uncultured Methanomethylovorans sp.]